MPSASALKNAQTLSLKSQEHTFELGDRVAVLTQVDQQAIIPHMAEVEGKKFPYEVRPFAPDACIMPLAACSEVCPCCRGCHFCPASALLIS